MQASLRIGVSGCGVAGMTVGWLLARQGHEITLFERAETVGPVGAGVLLQPSGQLVLQRLGLLDEVTTQAEPIERLLAHTHRGRTLTDLPYSELGSNCRAYGVHRGVLFDALYSRVQAAGVRVILGTEITRHRIDEGGVWLQDSSGSSRGPFDFVIAADGSRSALRASSGLRHQSFTYGYGVIWGVGPCAAVRGELYQIVRGTRSLIGLLPIGGGRCTLFCSLPLNEWDAIRASGFEAWKSALLNLCPRAEELFADINSFEQLSVTSYIHVRMPKSFDSHTIFLGDAGHAMSPHLGQGINLALIDAECLANAVAEAGTPVGAFMRCWRDRRAHVRYYSAVTLFLSPFFQSNAPLLGFGRDFSLPLMARIPAIRRPMIQTMAGIKTGFLTGAMSLEPLTYEAPRVNCDCV